MDYMRKQVTPFVVFFQGRAGSTYIMEALNSHPKIRAEMEITGVKRTQTKEYSELRKLLTPPLHGYYAATGFKVKLEDIRYPGSLKKLLKEIKPHIILLLRRNRVKMVISWINSARIAETTRDWNIYHEKDRLNPVTVDINDFNKVLKHVEKEKRRMESYVKSLKLPVLTLYYEDLLLNEQETLKRTCSFLGIVFIQMKGRCLKNTSDNLRKAIANFDELKNNFIGTQYEKMFDEVLVRRGK